MLQVVRTGRNPTMRYLHRTHRVSVSWLHERFAPEDAGPNHNLHIDYELTDRMCADIYTQIFTDPPKWLHACDLINVIDPRRFKEVSALLAEHSIPPDSGGGPPQPKLRDPPWHQSLPLLPRKQGTDSGTTGSYRIQR